MAITNIKAIKSESAMTNSESYIKNKEKTIYLKHAVDYIENQEKTLLEGSELVSGYNCDPATFKLQAQMLMDQYYQNKSENLGSGMKANYAFHFVLSFKEDKTELDPLQVERMALEFCKRHLGENFIAMTAVHMNTDNIHAHILVPAYGRDGYHKYYDNKETFSRMRQIADEIALENGLDIILNPKEKGGKSHYEYSQTQSGNSWKEQFKNDILEMAMASNTWNEYQINMTAAGYTVTEKQRCYLYEKDGHSIRDNQLPLEYRKEGIHHIIQQQLENYQLSKQKKHEKHPAYDRLYVPKYMNGHYLSNLERLIELMKTILNHFKDSYYSAILDQQYPDKVNYKSYQYKMDKLAAVSKIIDKYQVKTQDDLFNKIRSNNHNKLQLSTTLQRESDSMKRLKELDQTIDQYLTLKCAIEKLGISDQQLYINPSYDLEIQRNLSALDPPTKKQLSTLYNKTKSANVKIKYDFSLLTAKQTNEILNYLKDPDHHQKPDLIITQKESRQQYLLDKYQGFYHNNLSKIYNQNEPATKNQLLKIQDIIFTNPELVELDFTGLQKADAIRIINKYSKNPLLDINQDQYVTNELSDSQQRTLNELQELYPEEFEIAPDIHYTKQLYQAMYNYLLAKTDSLFDLEQPEPVSKINLKSYDQQTQKQIKEYCKLASILNSYGLASATDLERFKTDLSQREQRISDLNEQIDLCKRTYADLHQIELIINQATDKGFLFGPLYHGNTMELQQQVADILQADHHYNQLLTIQSHLDLIRRSRKKTLEIPCVKDKYLGNYEPLTRTQLQLLDQIKPYFSDLNDIKYQDMSFTEAEQLLSYVAYNDADNQIIQSSIEAEIQRQEREQTIKQIQAVEISK